MSHFVDTSNLENMYFAEIPIMALGIFWFIKSSEKLIEEKY